MRRLQATFALFWYVAAGLHAQQLDRPLRAVHLSGNWGHTADAVNLWEMDGTQPLVPLRYVEYLRSVHVDWVGFSVALHVEHSMDSTLERTYSDVRVATLSDDAVRQIVREFRAHGFSVYMTLAIESFEQEDELDAVEHPAPRFQLGDPGYPDTGVPNDHLYCTCARQIDPDFWPWRPSHPEHERFVGEFWESYAQQAIHFARIAQEEGVRMYSLGTETERLFRTRSGGDYWVNDFGPQLRSMVDRVRAVYSGLLTYDMSYKAYWRDWFAPGSWHLWEDLDLDVIGVSAWFPLIDEPPTTVMGVDSLRRAYERVFRDHLMPMAERNPGRPIVFLEYAAPDSVQAPADPASYPENPDIVFVDTNGNGIEDGAEVQDNMYRALFEVMNAHSGLMYGAFFWDTWIRSNEGLWEAPRPYRAYSFVGKLSEHTVREWYDRFRTAVWRLPVTAVGTLPARTLNVGAGAVVVPLADAFRNASTYQASSSAPGVATVSLSGSQVTLTAVAVGVATITVTASGADNSRATQRLRATVLPAATPGRTTPLTLDLTCHGYDEGATRAYNCIPEPSQQRHMSTFVPAVGSACDRGSIAEFPAGRIVFQIRCRDSSPGQSAAWSHSGRGPESFVKPIDVPRVWVRTSFSGSSVHLSVWCRAPRESLVVNELLGTSWGNDGTNGIYGMAGCRDVAVDTRAADLQWWFTPELAATALTPPRSWEHVTGAGSALGAEALDDLATAAELERAWGRPGGWLPDPRQGANTRGAVPTSGADGGTSVDVRIASRLEERADAVDGAIARSATRTVPLTLDLTCHGYDEGATRAYNCIPEPSQQRHMSTFVPAVGSACDRGSIAEFPAGRIVFQIRCRDGGSGQSAAWSYSGRGPESFVKPIETPRVWVRTSFSGSSVHLSVWCRAPRESLVVNELLGRSWGNDGTNGIYGMAGCREVEVATGAGEDVQWWFTQELDATALTPPRSWEHVTGAGSGLGAEALDDLATAADLERLWPRLPAVRR